MNFRFALLSIAISFVNASAQAGAAVSYSLDPRFRAGIRAYEPRGPAIIEAQTDGLVTYALNDRVTFQVGARFLSDAAYNYDRDHYRTLGGYEGAETELREANIDYRNGPLILRVGSQTVVWGEAFGTYYADIVNPKDLRQAGFGEIGDFRKPIEMINLQYVQNDWSLQMLLIPFYRADRLPRPYSDFFPASVADSITRAGFQLANVDFDQSANPQAKAPELALRYQGRLRAFDYSVFTFFLTDRTPVFQAGLKSFTELYVRTTSRPMNATGLTFSWAGDAVVVRGEYVHFGNRSFNFAKNTMFDPIGIAQSDQDVIVLGADMPLNQIALFSQAANWQFGGQISLDRVSGVEPLGRKQNESLVGFQIQRDTDRQTAYRFFGGVSPGDGSWLFQATASKWINENFKFGPELWLVQGQAGSRLGDIRQASRLMLVLKGAFRG